MSDDATIVPPAAEPGDDTPCEGGATPEELLAEQLADDPEVGVDGTGMGELP